MNWNLSATASDIRTLLIWLPAHATFGDQMTINIKSPLPPLNGILLPAVIILNKHAYVLINTQKTIACHRDG
jgi:hypothetical protein